MPLRRRLRHVARDEPGRDAVDRDAELAQLDRERLGEALQARLGGGVVGLPAVAQRRRAGQVDDTAEPVLDHVLLHGPRHQERAAQVHAHDHVPVQLGHLEQQVVPGDAGVVHQHEGRTELGRDAPDGGLDLLRVGHVRADGERPPARGLDRVDRALRRGLLEVDHRHREAVRGQPLRGGRADPARRPGHDRHALLALGHVLLSRRHIRCRRRHLPGVWNTGRHMPIVE